MRIFRQWARSLTLKISFGTRCRASSKNPRSIRLRLLKTTCAWVGSRLWLPSRHLSTIPTLVGASAYQAPGGWAGERIAVGRAQVIEHAGVLVDQPAGDRRIVEVGRINVLA